MSGIQEAKTRLIDAKKEYNDDCLLCALKDTRINEALAFLESVPDPTEFTKECKEVVIQGPEKQRNDSRAKRLLQACNIIDRLTVELAMLKDELTCEECEKSFNDPVTGVTALCMACWNAMVTKLRTEIDRLTNDLKHAESTSHFIRLNRELQDEIQRLMAELKAKDAEIARLKPKPLLFGNLYEFKVIINEAVPDNQIWFATQSQIDEALEYSRIQIEKALKGDKNHASES